MYQLRPILLCLALLFSYSLINANSYTNFDTDPAAIESSEKGLKNDEKAAKGDLKKAKGKAGKIKKTIKKWEKKLSFLNFFHHDDSVKLARQFIHQKQKLNRQKEYPYKIDYEKLKLKVKAYKANTDFDLKYEVLGWYPYWEKELYKNLNYSLLTTIAYFSYAVDPATGKPKNNSVYDWETTPLMDSAKVNGNKMLLTVTCFGAAPNRQFLSNPTAIDTLINRLKILLKSQEADGVCLDFEGVPKDQKANYSKFIIKLSQELKKDNKDYEIYMTIPAVNWTKALDFEVLTPVVDRFVIMGYGYYGSTSKVAGPVAPLNSGKKWEPYNLTTSMNYYLEHKVPADQLILALPYYGVLWDTETPNMGSKAIKFIGNRTYDYIKAKIGAPIQYDTISQSAWCSYVVEEGQYRQCWFDNDSTLSIKLNAIKAKGIAGMGIWALGYDKGYNDLWKAIDRNMCNTKILPIGGISTQESDSLNHKTPLEEGGSFISEKLHEISSLLQEMTNYRAILLIVLLLIVAFGGAAFIIAMFKADTRQYFFSSSAHRVYYSSFVLLFLIIVLRWIKLIDDISIALIVGFIVGALAIYFINKIISKTKRDRP